MLQALGSTTKTKISYAMFTACCFLIAGAFFVARMERIEFDDSHAFCATVYFSRKTGYRIEHWGQRNDFSEIGTGCARACLKERMASTGISFLEIETQSGHKDHNQAFAAGFLEGSLTWRSIYAQWTNTIQAFCEKNAQNGMFCKWVRRIVLDNFKNVMKLAKERNTIDQYQHQIFLFYHQLLGIETGFTKGVRRARQDFEISFEDLLLLNSRSDIEDLKVYYNEFVAEYEHQKMELKPRVGKMVMKVGCQEDLPPKVLFAHSSDGEFSSMLKIVKTYRFNYHNLSDVPNRLVTNTDITFTSYPGAISSSDDFYIAMGKHSRVIVAGVALKHHNGAQLMHGIDLDGGVFSSARIMAANRLSHNGKYWAHVMAREPEFGAKQWLIVDEKRIKNYSCDANSLESSEAVTSPTTTDEGHKDTNDISNKPILTGDLRSLQSPSDRNLIFLVDQTWGRLHAEEVTSRFRNDGGVWALDGHPYFKEILQLNNLQARTVKIDNVTSLEDAVSFLKVNAYRGDLLEDETTPFGNVDLKMYSSEDSKLFVQNGPVTTNSTGHFDWSSNIFSHIKHDEHPSLWNFSPVHVQFLWD